jgi:hypothetical protein
MTAPNSICKVVRDKHENTVAVFDVDGDVTLEVTCYNGFYDTDNVCWLHFGPEGLLKLAAVLTEAAEVMEALCS